MVLGFGGYRVPVDVLLLHDDAADVAPLRPSFDSLGEQIRPDDSRYDFRHAVGHRRSFGRPPLAVRPGGTRVVPAAMPATPLFGRGADPRPQDPQRLVNALVRGTGERHQHSGRHRPRDPGHAATAAPVASVTGTGHPLPPGGPQGGCQPLPVGRRLVPEHGEEC